MIYVCVPSYNEAPTVGLLLWKIRRTFSEFSREYQLLVMDDGSSDSTRELLEPYAKVLPMTVLRHRHPIGYGRSLEELLRLAVERTDRPKRDCAVMMHADFSHGAQYLPEFIKRIESGADLVVGKAKVEGERSHGHRWLRRTARYFLHGVRITGITDLVCGFAAVRLVSLKNAMRAQGGPLLTEDGWAANAELYGRVARHARRIETVEFTERHDLRERPSRVQSWESARRLWAAGRRLRLAPAQPFQAVQLDRRGEEAEPEEALR